MRLVIFTALLLMRIPPPDWESLPTIVQLIRSNVLVVSGTWSSMIAPPDMALFPYMVVLIKVTLSVPEGWLLSTMHTPP